MASASPLNVEDEVKCPICLECLTVSVSVDCGHIFCRGCISLFCEKWKELDEDLKRPLCKAKIKRQNFQPNWPLANIAEKIKCLSLNPGKDNLCVRHKEKLNLFCKEDQELVCVRCERSPEHRSHTVLLLEKAAKESKCQLCSCLEVLRKKREIILASKARTEKEGEDLLGQIEEKKTRTVAEFNQLQQFLEEQKMLSVSQLEELEKQAAARKEEHMARLTEELSYLEGLIQQMEEKCQQPASELLQDIRRTLESYEKTDEFKNPVAFPPELTCRIRGLRVVKPLLEGVMKQLKQAFKAFPPELTCRIRGLRVVKPLQLKQAFKAFPPELTCRIRGLRVVKPLQLKQASALNVTLDPETAHPYLILSEDLKSVRWRRTRQALPDNPERFDEWPCVLGRDGFTAGSHYWEVTVESEGRWAVGVARKSVRRKGSFVFCPEEGIWAVGKRGDQYRVFNPPDFTPLSLSQELNRIQVILNCGEGKVSFSDADTGLHLYTHSGVSFCRETLYPFFYVADKAHVRLSP